MTFAQKLGAGFAAVILVAALLVVVAVRALTSAAAGHTRLEEAPTEDLVALVHFRSATDHAVAQARVYLMTGDEASRRQADRALGEAAGHLDRLRREVSTENGKRLLAALTEAEAALYATLGRVVELRRSGRDPREVAAMADAEFDPRVGELDRAMDALGQHKARLLHAAKREALEQAHAVRRSILLAAAGGLLLACALAFLLTNTLARLHRDTEEAVRARDEFLSVASHELRTPLTALKLTVDHHLRVVDEDHLDVSAEARDVLLAVRRQTARLTRLVLQLLDVSRITAGRLQLEREQTDLAAVVRHVIASDSATFERADCEVRLQLPGSLSGCWDRLRLEQVVGNLLSNAAKYGAGKPIAVELTEADGRARLSVTDQGVGIDEADQARIFERFERAAGQGAGGGGFGLGLWIARRVVELHAGTITVRSKPGQGACFTVELPLAGPPAEGDVKSVAEPARPSVATGSPPRLPAGGAV